MQSSIWKLTALAGVVGIGFLVVLQAQRGLEQPPRQFVEQKGDTADENPADDEFFSDLGEPQEDELQQAESVAFGQTEPSAEPDWQPELTEGQSDSAGQTETVNAAQFFGQRNTLRHAETSEQSPRHDDEVSFNGYGLDFRDRDSNADMSRTADSEFGQSENSASDAGAPEFAAQRSPEAQATQIAASEAPETDHNPERGGTAGDPFDTQSVAGRESRDGGYGDTGANGDHLGDGPADQPARPSTKAEDDPSKPFPVIAGTRNVDQHSGTDLRTPTGFINPQEEPQFVESPDSAGRKSDGIEIWHGNEMSVTRTEPADPSRRLVPENSAFDPDAIQQIDGHAAEEDANGPELHPPTLGGHPPAIGEPMSNPTQLADPTAKPSSRLRNISPEAPRLLPIPHDEESVGLSPLSERPQQLESLRDIANETDASSYPLKTTGDSGSFLPNPAGDHGRLHADEGPPARDTVAGDENPADFGNPQPNPAAFNPFGAPPSGATSNQEESSSSTEGPGLTFPPTSPAEESLPARTQPATFPGADAEQQPFRRLQPQVPADVTEPRPFRVDTPDEQSVPRTPTLPTRSIPSPEEASLAPITPQELAGTGTLSASSPRGPQRPQLSIEKIAPPNAVLGEPMVYKIVVKNVGTTRARQVVVEDRIPKGTQLTGTKPRAELDEERLIWRLGTIEPNAVQTIAIRVVPQTAGQVGSVATVNFVADVAAATLITAPRLQLDVTAPPQADVGDPVVLRFKISNTGNGDAKGVLLRDIIPKGLTHASGNDLEYPVGDLKTGASKEITLQLTAVEIGHVDNHALVTAEGGLSVEADASIEIVGTSVVISRTGPQHRFLGREAVYTNTLTNDSDRPATGVTVFETVPAGMEFKTATGGGKYDETRRMIGWEIDSLGPHASKVLKVHLVPKTRGSKTNMVRAVDSRGRIVAEISSETNVEGYAALSLDIPSVQSPLSVGETAVFRVAVRNRGTEAATNVELTISAPEEIQMLSAGGPTSHTVEGQTVSFAPLERIEAGRQALFEVELRSIRAADARLKTQIKADQMRRPLTREEAVLILADSP